MKKIVALFALALLAQNAQANDDVNSAYALCSGLENSGSTIECEVKGWGKSVDVLIDMSGAEARKLCGPIADMVRGKFTGGWKLKIRSPYSGDNAIASCPLG